MHTLIHEVSRFIKFSLLNGALPFLTHEIIPVTRNVPTDTQMKHMILTPVWIESAWSTVILICIEAETLNTVLSKATIA
jgi:hypothetical protein